MPRTQKESNISKQDVPTAPFDSKPPHLERRDVIHHEPVADEGVDGGEGIDGGEGVDGGEDVGGQALQGAEGVPAALQRCRQLRRDRRRATGEGRGQVNKTSEHGTPAMSQRRDQQNERPVNGL